MDQIANLTGLIVEEFIRNIFNNYMFWLLVVIVTVQYRKISRTRQQICGIKDNSFIKNTLCATAFGIVGGLIGSLMLIEAGVTLTSLGIGYLWGLALILMFFNPRFLCFSYSGGLIAFSKLIFGKPGINIPQLMGLIAVLHLIESLLIYFNGSMGAVPMYFKRDNGRLIGGFMLQKFWPLPVVAIAFLSAPEAGGYSRLPVMGDWWPLISFSPNHILSLVGVLLPVVAGLGYSDIALAHTPKEKSRRSAFHLSIYSIVLLMLAVSSSHLPGLEVVAAAFAPLGHELVIYLGQQTEFRKRPLYISTMQGVRVLEVLPKSAALRAGIKTGDIIYSVNGRTVNNKADLETASCSGGILEFEFIMKLNNRWKRVPVKLKPGEGLGIIAVPEGNESVYTELGNTNYITKMIRKIRTIFSIEN